MDTENLAIRVKILEATRVSGMETPARPGVLGSPMSLMDPMDLMNSMDLMSLLNLMNLYFLDCLYCPAPLQWLSFPRLICLCSTRYRANCPCCQLALLLPAVCSPSDIACESKPGSFISISFQKRDTGAT